MRSNHNITFIFVYFLIFLISAVILLALGINIETALGASVATLSNVGTGLGQIGLGGVCPLPAGH